MIDYSQGVNSWYLDRQGRHDASQDDEQPAQGPDVWLDRVTGPASPRGRRAIITPGGYSADVDLDSATRDKKPAESQPKATRTRTKRRSTEPRDAAPSSRQLVAAARRVTRKADRTLSQNEVVAILQADGWKMAKGDLKLALKATGTSWQQLLFSPSAKTASRANGDKKAAKINAKTAARERAGEFSRKPIARAIEVMRRLQVTFPDMTEESVAHHLQAAGLPYSTGEVVQLRKILVEWQSRKAATRKGTPPTARRLAIPSGGAQPMRTIASSPPKPTVHSQKPLAGVCQSCGVTVSINGHCGCS